MRPTEINLIRAGIFVPLLRFEKRLRNPQSAFLKRIMRGGGKQEPLGFCEWAFLLMGMRRIPRKFAFETKLILAREAFQASVLMLLTICLTS